MDAFLCILKIIITLTFFGLIVASLIKYPVSYTHLTLPTNREV